MSKNNEISRRNFLRRSGAGAGLLGLGAYSEELSGYGQVNASKQSREKRLPGEVRVMSLSKSGLPEKDILGGMIERIRIMSANRPDIICLPEIFTGSTAKNAETVPGPTTEKLAAVSREMGAYIICPVHTLVDGKAYNSAVLIDRKGTIMGQYNKIYPVSVECIKGVIPGISKPPVFRTDFGTIGIQICFDINWIENWKSLKEQGAEIVFWPSAYPAGRMLPSYAWIFKYYIVGASWRDPATIYDITGDLIAMSGQWEHWAFATLNLEKVFLEIADYSGKLNEIKGRYGSSVLIRYYHDEDWVTIESRSPGLKIRDVLDEYKLIPHWDYIKIEEKEIDKYRKS
jgi:predicted amidohydrolase